MKNVPVYILLIVYAAVQLKPLTAVLQDVTAHTFFRMQHMATVHYENGHYHLHNELKTISEQEQNSSAQKNIPAEKTNETNWQQASTSFHFNFTPPEAIISFCILPGKALHEGFINSAWRPPVQT